MTLSERIAAARGEHPADLLLTNLQLVNVFTGEVYPTEIAIKGTHHRRRRRRLQRRETVDLGGRYVAPGLIDAHVHIESSLCTPPEFSRAALTHGVTSVITDPHEIANVHGLDGIRFMLESAAGGAAEHVRHGVKLRARHPHGDRRARSWTPPICCRCWTIPWVLGLAEMMNYPGVVYGDTGRAGQARRLRRGVRSTATAPA